MDQKQAERTARKLHEDLETKIKETQTKLEEALKQIEQLKEMNIQLEKEKIDLINKYDSDYESEVEGDDI